MLLPPHPSTHTHSAAPLRFPSQGWCKQRSHVDEHTCKADKHTYTKQSCCQGSLSATRPKAPPTAPPDLNSNGMFSSLSQCCAHTYVRSLQTTKEYKSVFLQQNNRCSIATVCIGFWSFFFLFSALCLWGICDKMSRLGNLSASLSLSPLQGHSVVCIFLSSFSSLASPPTLLLFSPPPALIFPLICCCLCHKGHILSLVIACLLATTPVAVIAAVWASGGEQCPLASGAPASLPPPFPTFASGVNPQGCGTVIWPVCTCAG